MSEKFRSASNEVGNTESAGSLKEKLNGTSAPDAGVDGDLDIQDLLKKYLPEFAEEAKTELKEILVEMLSVGTPDLDLSTKPAVVLVIGVNGVGKTTSIGKLAHRLKGEGKRVLLAAADTFRAAAAEQLTVSCRSLIWKLSVRIQSMVSNCSRLPKISISVGWMIGGVASWCC